MKERFLTLFAALGALFVVVVLMLPSAPREEKPVSLPTTVDHGDAGLAGLHDWLVRRDVPVLPLRDRYVALNENLDLPETGNLLVISVPQRVSLRHLETEQLREWVRRGNHVLLLAAFADWPEWAGRSQVHFWPVFSALELRVIEDAAGPTKNSAAVTPDDEEAASGTVVEIPSPLQTPAEETEILDVRLVPRARQHPLLQGVKAVLVKRRPDHTEWLSFAAPNGRRSGLVLMQDEASGAPALWRYRYGEGSIIISRHTGIFNNALLDKGDNARLFLNLVAYTTRGGGYVIFDDTHQGLTALYDPDAFWSDSRLHRSLLFLFALWVIYAIGHSNRMLVRRRRNTMLRLASHVEAVGGFFARRLTRAAAARRLLRHFFNELRRRLGMPQNGEPVWEFIEHQARVHPEDAAQLREIHARAADNRRVNLIKLNNLMYRLREAMS